MSGTHDLAAEHLSQCDRTLKRIIRRVGPCKLNFKKGGLQFLVESILSQQISKAAAASFIHKFRSSFDLPFEYDIHSCEEISLDRLKGIGVSRRKAEFIVGVIAAVRDDKLCFAKLGQLDDDDVIECLTGLKGIGLWTAQMYLLFVLGRPDVFPATDGAIQNAIQRAYGIEPHRRAQKHISLAEGWRPYRSTASWYLYRALDEGVLRD